MRFEAGANHSSEKASMEESSEDEVRSEPRQTSQREAPSIQGNIASYRCK